MSNGTTQPVTNALLSPAVQIAQLVVQAITVCFCAYISMLANKNQEKIQHIQGQQDQVTIKQDQAAETAEKVKVKLEETQENQRKIRGVELYSTWKYLEDVATSTGDVRDRTKAAEARKLYEEFVRIGK